MLLTGSLIDPPTAVAVQLFQAIDVVHESGVCPRTGCYSDASTWRMRSGLHLDLSATHEMRLGPGLPRSLSSTIACWHPLHAKVPVLKRFVMVPGRTAIDGARAAQDSSLLGAIKRQAEMLYSTWRCGRVGRAADSVTSVEMGLYMCDNPRCRAV